MNYFNSNRGAMSIKLLTPYASPVRMRYAVYLRSNDPWSAP